MTVNDYWLTTDVGDGWRAALRLVPYQGQVVVGEVRVFPAETFPATVRSHEPGQWSAEYLGFAAWDRLPKGSTVRRGVTARLLRRVPLGAHLKHVRKVIGGLATRKYTWLDLAERGLHSDRPEKRQRADRRSDTFYARMAADYVARIAAGSRSPVADIARRRHLSPSVVRDAIHAARERQLLTAGMRGTPDGTLTSDAAKMLRAATAAAARSRRNKGRERKVTACPMI